MLKEIGFNGDIAYSAGQAAQLLQQKQYHAMTLDMMLPDTDGITFLRQLRADHATRDLPVIVGREIVGLDHRRVRGLARTQPHDAATRGLQVAHAHRHGREPMQRLAEPVERERLHVELDVGALAVRVRPREHAELRRRHGERSAAAQGIIETHQAAADQGPIGPVQRAHVRHLVDRALL